MKENRLLLILLISILVFTLGACGPTNSQTPNESNQAVDTEAQDGTYESVKPGYNGDVKVQVTLKDGAITDIEILESTETEDLGEAAFEELIPKIIETQSVNIDTVSGATLSSNALIDGVKEILTENANLAAFEKETNQDSGQGETIEKTVDVVVVGAGGAGLSAAVEASKAGANTLVIEKMPRIGGNTAISSGNIYATGSQVQENLGLTDNGTPEDLTQFFMEQADGKVNEDFIRVVAENSGATVDWLTDEIGVTFKHREPEASHRSLISETSGVGITDKLAEKAEAQGAEIMVNTRATELLTDNGQVVGVKATEEDNEVIIHAKAVVLATGGYDGQDESKEKYAPGSVGHHTFSSPGNVGDAIEMVKPLDGKILLKGGLSGIHLVGEQALNSPLSPLRMIANGVGVTDLGYRYANESMTSAFDYYNPMVKTGRAQFYNIVDSTIPNELLDQAVEEGEAFKADSIEELAKAAGIPSFTLMTTIEEYNEASESGIDEEFGKDPEDMTPLVQPPFYAVKITPNTNGSFGGLVTDLETRVLTNSDTAIPGLYAAGAVANSEFFYLRYPVSGSSIIMGITLGRIAGTKAVSEMQ